MQCGLGVGFFLASFAWLFFGALGPNAWRYMFLIGVLPALMTLWIRRSIPESERWERVNDQRQAAIERQRSGEALGAQDVALTRFTVAGLFAELGDPPARHSCADHVIGDDARVLGHRRMDPAVHGGGCRQSPPQSAGMGRAMAAWRSTASP